MIQTPRRLPLLLLAAVCVPGIQAQDLPGIPLEIGRSYELKSQVYDDQRRIRVGLPASYGISSAQYPLLIVLDGDKHFESAVGVTRHLHWSDRMPEVIVVAVHYGNRSEEFIPAADAAKGAQRMRRFLLTELIPHLESEYRCAPHRILVGHSLGGLFVTDTMLEDTKSFQSYLALSPAIYWQEEAMRRRLEGMIEAEVELATNLFMCVGDHREREEIIDATTNFIASLEGAEPIRLRHQMRVLADTDHFDSSLLGMHYGLSFSFGDWRAWPIAHAGDWERLQQRYAEHSERLGYPVPIPEAMVNRVAYNRSREGDLDGSLQACQINVATYPGSANCHDSLGEALVALGRSEAAVAAFERACELAEASGDSRLPAFREHLEAARKRLQD